MKRTEDYIYGLAEPQREIIIYFHELLINWGLQDKIRFKIPFYYGKSWICYLNPLKDDKVELAFLRGNELSNEQGLLESKGRKQVSGITFTDIKTMPIDTILEILQEAIILDESSPYKSKRRSKK